MGDTTTTNDGSVEAVNETAATETVSEGSLEALGDPGKRALQAEREARKAAEAERKRLADDLAAASARIDEFEAANRSELENAQAAVAKAEAAKAELEARAVAAETALLRYKVAHGKGITGNALDLLVGSTREELEKKADSILALTANRGTAPVVTQEGHAPRVESGPASDFAAAMQAIL